MVRPRAGGRTKLDGQGAIGHVAAVVDEKSSRREALQRIGLTGSTNLAVVGPGISEALLATAAGLLAAIPAVIFYNHFVHRVKDFSAEMDDFSLEFLNIAERNFT